MTNTNTQTVTVDNAIRLVALRYSQDKNYRFEQAVEDLTPLLFVIGLLQVGFTTEEANRLLEVALADERTALDLDAAATRVLGNFVEQEELPSDYRLELVSDD